MTRRKSTREGASTVHNEGDPATWPKQPDPEIVVGDDEDRELDQVFSDFPQNEACIQLFRVNAQGGRPMFLEQLAPAMFSLAYVTEKYGGGRYHAKGRYRDGTGVRMPFEIEGDPFPVKRVQPNYNQSASPLAAVLPTQVNVPEPERQGQGIEAVLVTLMRQMMHEMRGSETAMLEKMKMYKDLFASPAQRETPMDQAINMFTRGVELASMNGGGGDGPNFWMMALKELKDPLTKIVDTIQVAVSRPTTIPVTVQTPTLGAPAQPVTVKPEEPMLGMLRLVLPSLINGAAKNSDTMVYVDYLLDQVPESMYPKLLEWLLKPGCLDDLATIEPGIRFQQDWWATLRGQLIAAIRGDDAASEVQPQPDINAATGATTSSTDIS